MVSKLKQFVAGQTFKNSYFSILDVAAIPVLMVVATPVFLSSLGVEQYGIWVLINSIVASLAVADVGGGDVVVRYVSSNRAHDLNRCRTVFKTVFSVYLMLVVMIFAFGFYVSPYVVNAGIFEVRREDVGLFSDVLRLGVGVFVIRLLEQIVLSYFKGMERYDLSSKLSMCSKVLVILVQIAVVLLGGGLEEVFRSMLVSSAFSLVLGLYFLSRFDPDIKISFGIDFEILKNIFGFGVWTWLYSVLSIVAFQMDKFIVGSLAGMNVLAYYSIAALVYNQLRSVLAAAVQWVFPRVSKNGVSSDSSIKLYTRLQWLVVGGSIVISLFLLIFDGVFLAWLGGETYQSSKGYIEAFILVLPFASATIVPYFFVNGGGYVKYNLAYKVIMSFATIGLMFCLYPLLGVYGLILSYVLVFVFVSGIQRTILQMILFSERNWLCGFFVLIPGFCLASVYYGFLA